MSKCYASAVLAIAAAEIGYHEKKSNSQLDNPTANAGSANYTKYARDFDEKYPKWYNGKKNGFAWCDMFVDWCMLTAFGYTNALRLLCQPERSAGAGCTYSLMYYEKQGRYHAKDPKPGDQIFFSTAHSKSNVSHTGLVEKVDGSKVYTIEGNTSDQVARRSYYLSDSYIVGYGRPAYDAEPGNANTGSQTSSNGTTSEVTYTVVAGDTLSKIAAKYGTTYQKLAAYNGITNPNIIRVGQKIKIPGTAAPKKTNAELAKEVIAGNGQRRRPQEAPRGRWLRLQRRPAGRQRSTLALSYNFTRTRKPARRSRAGFSCFIGPRAASIWRRPFCKPSCLCSGLRNHRHHDPPETSAGQDLQQSQPRNCAETHTPKDHADR